MKSSCALVTREEITISPRARSSCPGRNYHFLPGDECARRFHGKKLKRYRNLSTAIAYIDSYRNIGFPNGPVFRYGNFFIPRVEKSSKISPRAKNLVLPRAVGPREARFFSQGLIFEDFSTRGMKKFSYLKTTAHSEIVFLYELTKRFCAPI